MESSHGEERLLIGIRLELGAELNRTELNPDQGIVERAHMTMRTIDYPT